jgi:cation:H+ antiporter
MILSTLLLLAGGLALLVLGGELLVRGSARLAALAGLSPLVVGLTVVAYGTSAPEMAVSLRAGFSGNDSIAVANVVGSNIFNILFILGACATLAPLVVDRRLVRVDVPVMIVVSLAAGIFAIGGRISPLEGAFLAAGAVAYTVWSLRSGRVERAPAASGAEGQVLSAEGAGDEIPDDSVGWRWTAAVASLATLAFAGAALDWFAYSESAITLVGALIFLCAPLLCGGAKGQRADFARQLGLFLAGLGVLVVGAGWLVEGAVVLARSLGVTDAVIGLTIVAAGTSLPEVAASIIATIRGQRDIAIGNVVGSNIANLVAILGVASLATPGGLHVAPQLLRVDIPLMIGIAVVCLPAFYTGYLVRRWEGIVFFGAYLAYTAHLVADATGHAIAPALGEALAYVCAPVALAAFAATGFHALLTRDRRRSGA